MVDWRFVVVSKEQINMMKENAIPISTKGSEVRVTLLEDKI